MARAQRRPLLRRRESRPGASGGRALTSGCAPDEAQAFQGQPRIDPFDRPRVRRDQLRQPAGGDRRRFGAKLAADPAHDRVHLAAKP